MDAYRRAARADALQKAINDKLVADVVDQPTSQRHVAEIFLKVSQSGAGQGTGDEVKVRHILFAPNDDAQGAQAVPDGDPAWKKAEDEANAEYQKLLKDPSTFAADATAMSDDEGTKAAGGDLPYYTRVNLDKAFGDAVFADGLQKDQLLPPVKSAFGWHVIQFLDRRKQPLDRMKDFKAQIQGGADFAAIATANSEDPTTKANGGDLGWIAKYQLNSIRELAIFKAQVGGLTDVIEDTDGIYLFKVLGEETRAVDATQAATIRSSAFSNWYNAQKLAARITRDFSTGNGTDSNLPVVQ
jgi:parvulin-like peptidyl-prolyl isomerase